jgi:hypothetical protein
MAADHVLIDRATVAPAPQALRFDTLFDGVH